MNREQVLGTESNTRRKTSYRKVTIVMMLATSLFLLSSCQLGRGEEQRAPVSLETYQSAEAAALDEEAAASDDVQAGSGEPSTTTAEEPASVQTSNRDELLGRYTAEIVPVNQVPVIPEVAGQVIDFDLEVGDRVQQNDIVMVIDSNILEAQRTQALAGLQAAQAQLDLLLEGADENDVEALRASVAAAEESYQRALEGPTAEDLTMAEAQLRQAEAAVRQAQAAYDEVSWNPLIAALPQSVQLESATLAYEAAQAQYDKITKGATEDVIAGAYAQLAGARAQLNTLEEGAKPAQIEAAQAQVNQAESALYLAQLQLEKASVRAPVDGIVASVSTAEGSMAAPGSPALVLLSPDIEITVAVEETRLPLLRIGQPASIQVEAYPNEVFDGEIAIIAPTLDPATRRVQVTIRPTGDASALLPGMFATVELGQ